MKYWVILLALIAGCVRAAPPPITPTPPPPVVKLTIHVDVDFSSSELVLLGIAIQRLHDDTEGRFVGTMIVDVDFSKPQILAKVPADAWVIARLDDGTEAAILDENLGARVLGATVSAKHVTYLIPSRTPTVGEFVHVAEHEILHALGCDHTKSKSDILWSKGNADAPVYMSPADIKEFCRATKLQGAPCN